MKSPTTICRRAVLAIATLYCASGLAQETSLEAAELPEPEPSSAVHADAHEVVDELIVRGRSRIFLQERLELAEDKLYAVYNDINTIEEFDIHCRLHARTGTRVPQRICMPNFEKEVNARKGQAVLAALRGEAFGTDWQQPEAEMMHKATLLEAHMQQLALEHPELLEAMSELYEAMQDAMPRRYGPDAAR